MEAQKLLDNMYEFIIKNLQINENEIKTLTPEKLHMKSADCHADTVFCITCILEILLQKKVINEHDIENMNKKICIENMNKKVCEERKRKNNK